RDRARRLDVRVGDQVVARERAGCLLRRRAPGQVPVAHEEPVGEHRRGEPEDPAGALSHVSDPRPGLRAARACPTLDGPAVMTLRRIAPILLVLAAAFAAPGFARAGTPVLFTDPAEGGNAPDITHIWVGNTAQYFTAWVTLANRPDGIGEQDVVTLYMDKDGLSGTGDPDHFGAHRYVQAINVAGTLHAVFGVWTAG